MLKRVGVSILLVAVTILAATVMIAALNYVPADGETKHMAGTAKDEEPSSESTKIVMLESSVQEDQARLDADETNLKLIQTQLAKYNDSVDGLHKYIQTELQTISNGAESSSNGTDSRVFWSEVVAWLSAAVSAVAISVVLLGAFLRRSRNDPNDPLSNSNPSVLDQRINKVFKENLSGYKKNLDTQFELTLSRHKETLSRHVEEQFVAIKAEYDELSGDVDRVHLQLRDQHARQLQPPYPPQYKPPPPPPTPRAPEPERFVPPPQTKSPQILVDTSNLVSDFNRLVSGFRDEAFYKDLLQFRTKYHVKAVDRDRNTSNRIIAAENIETAEFWLCYDGNDAQYLTPSTTWVDNVASLTANNYFDAKSLFKEWFSHDSSAEVSTIRLDAAAQVLLVDSNTVELTRPGRISLCRS